ncbi:hypothetical protein KJ780_01180 [Candidatus Micrarchaeota archaeon]|nr:hypothetical protein [Candidatus Micrarchaeota archaeon]
MKKIVVPGEQLYNKPVRNESMYVEDNNTYAAVIGFMDEENRFVPTKSAYRPKPGDAVVGVVVYIRSNGYKVDLNLPFEGFLSGKDTRVPFSMGEIMFAKVRDVDEVGNVDLTDARKLGPGKIVNFPSAKVPRLIGKRNSMLQTIRDGTGTEIFIGNNGYIWLAGGNIPLALKAINIVNKKSHTSGLTQQIADFLAANKD